MVKAKDVMTDLLVTVSKDTSMYKVGQLLSMHNITGIPVVDEEMHIVGVITEKDMLDLYHVMQYTESRTVSSSMSRDVITFDVEDDLDDVCQCFKEHSFRRVPVTRDGKIAGVISRRDLILHMLKIRRTNDVSYGVTY